MSDYIVVQPAKQTGCSLVSIVEGDDTVVSKPFESWCMNQGKASLLIRTGLHKKLARYHLFGSYEKGATYAVSYEEMCGIVTSAVGPSDRERYMRLKNRKAFIDERRLHRIMAMVFKSLGLVAYCGWLMIKLMAVLLIVPFVIMALKNHKRH